MVIKNNELYKSGTQSVIQFFNNSETGEQQEIVIPKGHNVSFAIKCGDSSDLVDLKITMSDGGDKYVLVNNMSLGHEPDTIYANIYSILVDINVNSSNDITFEITSFERK